MPPEKMPPSAKRDAWTQTAKVVSVQECENRLLFCGPSSSKLLEGVNYEKMKIEKRRFLSLLKTTPYENAKALAQTGFFHHVNTVQCAFCLNVIDIEEAKNWSNPHKEHAVKFPRCPFVCRLPVGNLKPSYTDLSEIPISVTYCGSFSPDYEIFY